MKPGEFAKASFLRYQEYSSHWKIAADIHEVPASFSNQSIKSPRFTLWDVALSRIKCDSSYEGLEEEKEWISQTS